MEVLVNTYSREVFELASTNPGPARKNEIGLVRRRRTRMSDREVVRLACQSDCVHDHLPESELFVLATRWRASVELLSREPTWPLCQRLSTQTSRCAHVSRSDAYAVRRVQALSDLVWGCQRAVRSGRSGVACRGRLVASASRLGHPEMSASSPGSESALLRMC